MVEIAKPHLSQQKIVHVARALVSLILVGANESSEHWTTTRINCVKVNCDIADFGDGVCCISQEEIFILFQKIF